jgi:hypothetical protein
MSIEDSSDPVREYLRIAEVVPPLDPDEEKALATASRGGDQVARKKLIEASLRLVIPIARQYEGRGVALPDLLEEGNLGVVRAVEKFDPETDRTSSEVAKQFIEPSQPPSPEASIWCICGAATSGLRRNPSGVTLRGIVQILPIRTIWRASAHPRRSPSASLASHG